MKAPTSLLVLVPVVSRVIAQVVPHFAQAVKTAVPLPAVLALNHVVTMACVTVVTTVVAILKVMPMDIAQITLAAALTVVQGFVKKDRSRGVP